jgi:hypothetical protein
MINRPSPHTIGRVMTAVDGRQEVSMSVRHVLGAVTAVAVTCGMVAGGSAQAQQGGGILPPEESGLITVAGCLLRIGDSDDKYVLAQPRRGPIASVSEERCTALPGATAFELEDTSDVGLNSSMVGRWIEINGRLERETSDDPDNLRELQVRSFRIVPVVRPPETAAAAAERPQQMPAAAPTERTPAPVATAGTASAELPRTASPLPAVAVMGLLLLAGGFALRSFRSPKRG